MDYNNHHTNATTNSTLYTDINCNANLYSKTNTNNLDEFFNQESPNKFPQLIICNDNSRNNQSKDIYKKYMDIITDNYGNRYNIHNMQNSAGILQAGYSANIDLDSHLKNINYYNDKCYYDNWKTNPQTFLNNNNNTATLTPDYKAIGRNDNNCINTSSTNIRQRYCFDNNKLQMESCIKPNEWKPFTKVIQQTINTSSNNTSRDPDSITKNQQHDFYKFFDDTPCVIYPNQRLFNNITKRSMLPNHHFRNIDPIYIK